jgi:hypothetical protein
MSTPIDWDQAPPGATHYRRSQDCWYKDSPQDLSYWACLVRQWRPSALPDLAWRDGLRDGDIVPRPASQAPQSGLTPQRKQHLYDQYVLAIINDGGWYQAAKPLIDKGLSGRFISTTRDRVAPLRDALGDPRLTPEERAFVYLLIWEYQGGTGDALLAGLSPSSQLAEPLRQMLAARATQPATTEQTEPTTEEPTVNNSTTAFETRHYVFGQDVSTLSEGQLVDAIKRIENEIADLKTVKTKSTKIAAKVADLNTMLAKVVEVLDAK